MKKQQGFTLIELMIVVAIIGILAAIAIPQYQNYIARTQITRVVGEISALKTAAEVSLMSGSYPSDANDLDFTSSNILSGDPTVTFASGSSGYGTIAATLGRNASPAIATTTVTLTRSSAGVWTCVTSGLGKSFAPAGCE